MLGVLSIVLVLRGLRLPLKRSGGVECCKPLEGPLGQGDPLQPPLFGQLGDDPDEGAVLVSQALVV